MAFSRCNPFVPAVYFLSVLLIAMFLPNPLFSLIALAGAAAFCAVFGGQTMGDRWFLPLLFLLITLTNPFFSHNGATVLFYMNGNAVTAEALFYGAGIALTIVSVILWCRALSLVMTGDKLVYLAGKTTPQLSIVLAAALRYIPLLRRKSREIGRAQKAMGIYTSDSYPDRVKAVLRIFSALVTWSLENAIETGKAMKARGGGTKNRTYYSTYRFSGRDAALLAVVLLLTAIILIAAFSQQLEFRYYPTVTFPAITAGFAAAAAAFAGLSFLPVVLALMERMKWNYYKSKI